MSSQLEVVQMYNESKNGLEMRKMTDFKTPVWKIQAFQNAVNHILSNRTSDIDSSNRFIDAFTETLHRIPSQDELFPVLVYTVMQANIDLLSYNVE